MPLIQELTKESWDQNLGLRIQLQTQAKQRILSCTQDPRVIKLFTAIESEIRRLVEDKAFKDKNAIDTNGVPNHKKVDQDAHRKIIKIVNALIQAANRIKPDEKKPATIKSDAIYNDLRSSCLTKDQPLYTALGGGRFSITSHTSFTNVKNAIENDIDKTPLLADQKRGDITTVTATDAETDDFSAAAAIMKRLSAQYDSTALSLDPPHSVAVTTAAAAITNTPAALPAGIPTMQNPAAASLTDEDDEDDDKAESAARSAHSQAVATDSKLATAAVGSVMSLTSARAAAAIPAWLTEIAAQTETLVLFNDDILLENRGFRDQLRSLDFFVDTTNTHFHRSSLKTGDLESLAIILNSRPNVKTLAVNNVHNAQELAAFLRQNTTVQTLVVCVWNDNQNAMAMKDALKYNRALTKLYFVGDQTFGGSYNELLDVIPDIIGSNQTLALIDCSRSCAIATPGDLNALLPRLANNRSLTHLEISGNRWGSMWDDHFAGKLSQLLLKKILDSNRARKANTKFTHELTFQEVQPHLPFKLEKSFGFEPVWTLRDHNSDWNLPLGADSPWLTPAFSHVKHLLIFPANLSITAHKDDKSDIGDDKLELLESFLPYLSSLTSITISDSLWGQLQSTATLLCVVTNISSNNLTQLSIVDCVVDNNVIAAICSLISANQLEKLQIESNALDDKMIGVLSKALETNRSLIELKMKGKIGNVGVIAVSNMLRVNYTLKTLELNGPLDLTALKALRSALTENRSLCYLRFTYDCSNADAQAASEIIKDIDRQLDRNIALRKKSTTNWRFLAVFIATMRVNNTPAFPSKMMASLSDVLRFSSLDEAEFPACAHSSGHPVARGIAMSPRLRSYSPVDAKRSAPPLSPKLSPPVSPYYALARAGRVTTAAGVETATAAACATSPQMYGRAFSPPPFSPLPASARGQTRAGNTYAPTLANISARKTKAANSGAKNGSNDDLTVAYGKKRPMIGRLKFREKLANITFQNDSKVQLGREIQQRIADQENERELGTPQSATTPTAADKGKTNNKSPDLRTPLPAPLKVNASSSPAPAKHQATRKEARSVPLSSPNLSMQRRLSF